MSLDVAFALCAACKEHLGSSHMQHRQPFLDRISYPAALLVAAILGFAGALAGVSASEAVTTRQGPSEALRVETAKPPQCLIPKRPSPGFVFL